MKRRKLVRYLAICGPFSIIGKIANISSAVNGFFMVPRLFKFIDDKVFPDSPKVQPIENKENIDMLKKIFPAKEFGTLPGKDYLESNEIKDDPHCNIAAAAYHNIVLYNNQPIEVKSDYITIEKRIQNEVYSGSPQASINAREYLPYWNVKYTPSKTEWDFGYRQYLGIDKNRIPYHFLIFPNEKNVLMVSERSQCEKLKSRKGLKDEFGQIFIPDYPLKNEYLKDDFLLISSLPKITKDGSIIGKIILISGGHGPGTEAFSLLFKNSITPYSLIEKIAEYLKYNDGTYAQFFQIPIRVSNIEIVKRDENLTQGKNINTMIANKLSLIDEFPPKLISI